MAQKSNFRLHAACFSSSAAASRSAHEVPVLTDATFKVNFFWTPFSPSSSIHLETKQRLLLGHVDSWHINIPVLVVGVSPECRVLRVRAADVFSRGFSSGSDKHAIRFWNLSIRILRLTRRNKTCGGNYPVLAVFLVTTCSTTSRVGISESSAPISSSSPGQ
ncbi:hypothetical protein K438DRAFT_1768904 [Mycena galopus ATCC 62051]|nr:hypothetical protein K438DRAFT_1768904 [Mycena galopus ATCC 62051]